MLVEVVQEKQSVSLFRPFVLLSIQKMNDSVGEIAAKSWDREVYEFVLKYLLKKAEVKWIKEILSRSNYLTFRPLQRGVEDLIKGMVQRKEVITACELSRFLAEFIVRVREDHY